MIGKSLGQTAGVLLGLAALCSCGTPLASDNSEAEPSVVAAAITPPASLVKLLSPTPYVETSCVAATYPGWPYAAKRCTYTSGPLSTSVTVADPSAARAAAWVVDSAIEIPRLQALAGVHQADYEDGLKAIGLAMLNQSSRIFPLTGGIIENMGSGYVNYAFEKGVTKTCSTGCYCRINSLHRTEYCRYRDAKKLENWGAECLQGHADAFNQDRNEHFRAKAYIANLTVASRCPTAASCTAAQVVAAVKAGYGG
jgi:hypothetical protein